MRLASRPRTMPELTPAAWDGIVALIQGRNDR